MRYTNVQKGKFVSRPNRFIAHVMIDGKKEICHVKNTGRCKELLIPGATVYVQKTKNPNRKTKYDLISVYKNGVLVNIDSQAPNQIFADWLKTSRFKKNIKSIKQEYSFLDSRLDFFIETSQEKILVETKGVTLEKQGIAMFPDAPTERGIKHIENLIAAKEQGFCAYIVFIIQMQGTIYFTPNYETHPAFGEALKRAKAKNVGILAYDCQVQKDSIVLDHRIPIRI